MSRPIVYVSCAQRCEIQRFELSPDTGALHLLGATPVPGIQGPSNTSMPLAASPDRRVLHAAVRPKDAALSAQAQHIMQILTAELPTKQAAVLAAQISGENKKALYDWALVQKQDKGN